MFFLIFSSEEFISEFLKLAGTAEWMGTYIDLILEKSGAEMVLIIGKLLAGKSFEEGEECEYIPIDPIKPVEPTPHSTPKKGEVPVAATLIENLKKL